MTLVKNFRFSPNPNKAEQIDWHNWDDNAFAEAAETGKPILLAISGIWCHWCHVMDEKTYSDPRIINMINEDFIAIRVDTDERPDINYRYNLGGWPATAILNQEGKLITGGTYLPPDRMLSFLEQVARLFQEKPAEVDRLAVDIGEEEWEEAAEENEIPDLGTITEIKNLVKDSYDSHFGGFGTQQKFPMVDVLEFALDTALEEQDDALLSIVEKTLRSMADGGLFDDIEGGFFRYSTRRDWTEPHYEKMLEDNARLVTLLLRTFQVTEDGFYRDKAEEVLTYLEDYLYIDDKHAWAGSQDADENYYRSSTRVRRTLDKPFVDENIYTDKNGLMAEALVTSGQVLHQVKWLDLAEKTLEGIWQRSFQEETGLKHLYKDGSASLPGYLDDNWSIGRAQNYLYQVTAKDKWLDRTRQLADLVLENLQTPRGPFRDVISSGSTPEAKNAYFDLDSNAMAARWLIQTYHLTGNEDYLKAARGALAYWKDKLGDHGIMAARYASAIREIRRDWLDIALVGRPEEIGPFKKIVLGIYWPRLSLTCLNPAAEEDLSTMEKRGFIESDTPQALICIGDRCLRPLYEPGELKDFFARNIPYRGTPVTI